jgi:hypothetical protein
MSLVLPDGHYLLEAWIRLENQADYFLQNNSRIANCSVNPNISPGFVQTAVFLDGYQQNLSLGNITLPTTANLFLSGGTHTVTVRCVLSNGDVDHEHSQVYVTHANLTAIKVDSLNRQDWNP